jgi:1-acyl-sn-glycerol-3-phosphate acyltransferase
MRDRVYRSVIRIGRAVFALLAIRLDIRGTEHLPTSGVAVVASNHIG